MKRFALTAAAVLCATPAARAAPHDPWLGKDKALHFAATSTLSIGGYAVGRAAFEERSQAALLGAGLAMGAGVAKELADLGGAGNASWRDLTWDAIGTATGLLFAWTLDRLFERWFTAPPAPG